MSATFTIEISGGDEAPDKGGDSLPWAHEPPAPVLPGGDSLPWAHGIPAPVLPGGGTPPPWAHDIPPPAPVIPEPGSRVPAFDRPVAVLIMGPRPLPVVIVGGEPSAPSDKTPADPKEPRPNRQLPEKVAFDFLGGYYRNLGNAGAGFAGNSAMPAFQSAISVASQGLSMLGPQGMAAAAALGAIGSLAGAVKQTIDAFVARGRELLPYSANIAGSAARADVRRLQGDIREADRLGPQFARLIDAVSKNEATIQRILEPIKAFLLDKLANALERGNETLVGLLEAADEISLKKFPAIREMINDIKGILSGDGDVSLIGKWISPVSGAAPPPAGAPVGGPLRLPLVMG